MTRSIPWPRILAEGFAIVVSILLAFGIQAWWEGRQQEATRNDLLSTMLESVLLNQATLAENIQGSRRNLLLATDFYARQDSELAAVSVDSAAIFFNSLNQPNTYDFSGGPLSRALDGGQLGLVSDTEILAALDAWSQKVTELAERSSALSESAQAVLEGLGAHTSYQQVAFFYYGRNQRALTPEESALHALELPSTVDLRPVRNDASIMAPATAMTLQRIVYIRFANELGDVLTSLEQLLRSRLDKN